MEGKRRAGVVAGVGSEKEARVGSAKGAGARTRVGSVKGAGAGTGNAVRARRNDVVAPRAGNAEGASDHPCAYAFIRLSFITVVCLVAIFILFILYRFWLLLLIVIQY